MFLPYHVCLFRYHDSRNNIGRSSSYGQYRGALDSGGTNLAIDFVM